MESSNAPITTRPSQAVAVNFMVTYSFLAFALFAILLATGALLGEYVDGVTWTLPLAIPMMLSLLDWMTSPRPNLSEEARQRADLSRWEV
jgi:hypothetical protein